MTRPGGVWRNWSRSVRVRPQYVERPPTPEAVQRAVESAVRRGLRVKAVGASHSFSAIAAAPGVLLDLDELSGLVSADPDRGRVTVRAGTPLHRMPRLLAPYGLAMPSLGDIDRQTLAGAISTGTHGTGLGFGGIATQVVGATLVTGSGEMLTVTDDPRDDNAHLLPAVALGLGALGILVDVTLQCVPAFLLEAVERPEPLDDVVSDLAGRAEASDHFEFFWFAGTDRALTKTLTRLPESAVRRPLRPLQRFVDDRLLGTGVHRVTCAAGRVVPATVPAINRMATRVWTDREFTDVSPRVFATPRGVRFHEMEYAVPLDRLAPAFEAVRELIRRRRWRISFPVEVRTAAADDLWMSTAHDRATGYIAVHRYWREDPTEYFTEVEQVLADFEGRPHWGKMHTQDAATLRERYARFDDFIAVRDRLDPEGRFRNAYLDRVLGVPGEAAGAGAGEAL